MTEMTTSETLNRAADHIQKYGHRKSGLGSEGHPTCALGAIIAVTSRQGFAEHAIPLRRYVPGGSIMEWNNAPERTASEVIEALRACAVIEESRERQAVSA